MNRKRSSNCESPIQNRASQLSLIYWTYIRWRMWCPPSESYVIPVQKQEHQRIEDDEIRQSLKYRMVQESSGWQSYLRWRGCNQHAGASKVSPRCHARLGHACALTVSLLTSIYLWRQPDASQFREHRSNPKQDAQSPVHASHQKMLDMHERFPLIPRRALTVVVYLPCPFW